MLRGVPNSIDGCRQEFGGVSPPTAVCSSVARWWAIVRIVGLAAGLSLLVGCFGAPDETEQVTETLPFEYGRLRALPDLDSLINQAKPGHWIAAHQRMTAADDFQGRIESRVLDNANRPIATEMATHTMIDVRPVFLSAAEPKDIELQFYIPRRLDRESRTVTLENRLFDRAGRLADTQGGSVSLMPDYRFFGIALSTAPARYAYLNRLLTNRIDDGLETVQFTQVVLPSVEPFVPLPSDVFGWTSIAWILWDDLDPDRLEPAQQQALIDWLGHPLRWRHVLVHRWRYASVPSANSMPLPCLPAPKSPLCAMVIFAKQTHQNWSLAILSSQKRATKLWWMVCWSVMPNSN
mgnify:CR=1 FL=1